MISIIVSWIIIAACSFVVGTTAISLFYGKESILLKEYETGIILGLAFWTFYAQVWSLFGGLGYVAVVGMLVLTAIAMIVLIVTGYNFRAIMTDIKHLPAIKKMSLLLAFIGVLLWTNMIPQHYDTYLYHAQAIRWIEEYGVVPGLANLHFRLGYDSALMSLQALFSFMWLLGQSLHAVNGFFTLIIIAYVIVTTKRVADRVKIADLLRIGFWLYILYDSVSVSSPNTDTIALMLAYYILLKWMEYAENGCKDINKYAFMCVLVVFATTVKVSVGIFVLLVIYPAVELVRQKKIRSICGHLLAGIALLVPYLIRNVIISGYYLYPYDFTVIKKFDWIVPKAILEADRAEIISWGRGNQDITRNAEHIWQWLPEWFSGINIMWKAMMILSVLALLVIVVISVCRRFRWRWNPSCCGICVCVVGLLFWLVTAPLPRYGIIYMVTLPCIAFSMLANIGKLKNVVIGLLNRITNIVNCGMVLLYIAIFIVYISITDVGTGTIVMQGDYANRETYIDESLGVDIAVAVDGDQTGYDPFPSVPYAGALPWITLRGDSLKDGFRY